jgi:dephospho-CoA kinase
VPVSTYVVGLTGGIGSGKSVVSALFESLGVHVVDVDVISRQLTGANGEAVAQIAAVFPDAVSNGVIDRERLRFLAFANDNNRIALESIIHPLIRAESVQQVLKAAANRKSYVLLVVPLLFESDFYARAVECAVAVDVDRPTQVSRLIAARSIDVTTVEKIIAVQMPRKERLMRTQFVINNHGDVTELARQVRMLHQVFEASARAHSKQPN